MSNSPLLRVEALGKAFHGRPVLHEVSFELAAGEVLGMIGSSGSGKSTLLRCLNMLERPDSGHVWLDGEEIGFHGPQRRPVATRVLARQRAAMAMVFQHFNLWPHRTVLENVTEAPRIVRGVHREQAMEEGLAALRRMGLGHKADAYPVTLSGGQQQRVSIARALVMKPRLILFDEPTSALDPELVGEVLAVMTDLAQSGTTMIVVTHEMNFALQVCHRILLLDQGCIIDEGSPQALLSRPASAPVRRFIGAACTVQESHGT